MSSKICIGTMKWGGSQNIWQFLNIKNIDRNVNSIQELRPFVPASSLWRQPVGKSSREKHKTWHKHAGLVLVCTQITGSVLVLSLLETKFFWPPGHLEAISSIRRLRTTVKKFSFFFFFLYNPTRHPLLLACWERINNLSLSAFPILFLIL